MPRLFEWAGRPRSLLLLLAITLLSGVAMLPAISTMSDHGSSLIAFEDAGSVSRMHEVLGELGDPGKAAAWWQLAFDLPFLIGYGLFAAGACAAVARRAGPARRPRLEQAAKVFAWFGPLGAGVDFLQNVSLALVLSGHVNQPWPRISALGVVTTPLVGAALVFSLIGTVLTRAPGAARPTGAAG